MNFLKLLWVASILVLLAKSASAEVKIGFVDVQKVLITVKEGVNAKNKLESILKKKQDKIDKMEEELKKIMEELEQQKSLMTEDKKRQKLQDYQKKFRELQDYYINNQRKIAEEQEKLTKPIFEKMEKIIKKIGQEKGFALIIEKAVVLYNASALDLTDEVITAYDAQK